MPSEATGIQVRKQRGGYTLVYNDMLPTGAISARAWGIYVYLLSRPGGWETRVSHLQTVFSEGRDAIYTALRQLVALDLMGREDYIEDGLRRTRYVLDADQGKTPGQPPHTGSQDAGTPDAGNPAPENPGQVTKEVTTTEITNTETPSAPSLRSGTADDSAARALATAWWEHYTKNFGPVVQTGGSPYLGLVKMIHGALRTGYSETEIKRALLGDGTRTPDAVPSKPLWQRSLSDARKGRSGGGYRPSNVHQLPVDHPDRERQVGAFR